MANVQIAIIDQQNTQIALAAPSETEVTVAVPGIQGPVGKGVPAGGTANQVLFKQSGTDYDTAWSNVTSDMIGDLEIVDADIAASAAIAGTKISPNFGSQNVVTTGTSTAASFIPTSSTVPSNGVYLPSANNVAISTNGTGRLFVDASGNVGIGTGSPSNPLHIANTSPAIRLEDTDGTSQYSNIAHLGSNLFVDVRDGAAGGATIVRTYPSTERLRITSDGKLGLGTSAPGTTLEVNQAPNSAWVQISSIEKTSSAVGAAPGAEFIGSRGDNNDTFYGRLCLGARRNDGTAIQAEKRIGGILFGGQHGTGTTYASSDVAYAASIVGVSESIFTNASTMSTAIAFRTGSTGEDPRTPNKNYGTERMRIDSSGRVGVGTTSPGSTFDCRGAVTIVDNTTSSLFIKNNTSDSTGLLLYSNNAGESYIRAGYGPLVFRGASSDYGRWDSSGRLLVGTSSQSGGALLQVNGDRIRVATAKTPASATDTGTAGEICWDASYIYVCTATNTWKRAALSTW